MDSLCEIHVASFPIIFEKATVTVVRPVHEVANDCDDGFRVDRSQTLRFVLVLASSSMPVWTCHLGRQGAQVPEAVCNMASTKIRRTIRLVRGIGAGSAVTLFVSYCAFRLHFNLSTAGSIDLLIVVLVALKVGFWEATGSSLVAAGCLAYFFASPILSLRVADPENWVALASFELTALIVSRLSGQVQNQTREAVLERSNATKLYELSRSILVLNRQEPAGPQIASSIAAHIGVDGVAIFDPDLTRSYSAGRCVKEDEESARSAYFGDTAGHDELKAYRWRRVLRSGSKPIGSLVLCATDLSPLMVDAIASLVTAALERARSFEKESRAEAARQSEQLRTAVLDSLAHAFKTPLTVILTSTSGLLEMNHLIPPQAELVELIDQHATHLTALTTHLLRMAKLESAEIRVRSEEVEVAHLIDEIVDECRGQLGEHPLQVHIADADLAVSADPQLLSITIIEFIINAAKYSGGNSAITISAQQLAGRVVISIHNEGSVVAFEERERIFERFYRSPATQHYASGSGIGLAVAKKTAEAHQGSVWVSSDETRGTTFFLSLPALIRRENELVAK
jgi:two-component system, OmpR family, sensor histidine kinase KdpD